MSILKLDCQVQHYPWGSLSSIPDLLGRDNSDALPWAELWMGAHSKASSALPGGELLIDHLKARGEELPFLFKILAAKTPLSIQCHPNKQQAIDGFAREKAAGVRMDAPHRNYRDTNHKPEIIVALEDFWALRGFRETKQIAELLTLAGIEHFSGPLTHGLQAFCQALFALTPHESATILQTLSTGCEQLPGEEARWCRELLRLYPHDIGCLAPLFLRVLHLSSGQALYLGAGELHSYLRGTGLELMANSDNVLRGGLTPKHVDPAELMHILRFEPGTSEILKADANGDYPSPSDDFLLTRITLATPRVHTPRNHEIWLVLGGHATVESPEGDLRIASGEVYFCSDDTGPLTVQGEGDLWIASSPQRTEP